jgi:hypothetical protein
MTKIICNVNPPCHQSINNILRNVVCTYRKTNKDDILALAILLHVTEYGNDNTAVSSISLDFKAKQGKEKLYV